MFSDFLETVYTYRVTTPDVLRRCFSRMSEEQVQEIQEEMVSSGLIARVPGIELVLFQLTKEGVQSLASQYPGVKVDGFRELSGIHLVRAFGMLNFCQYGSRRRRLPDFEELSEKYPGFERFWSQGFGRAMCLYVETHDQVERLGVCYVDPGRAPQRLVREMHDISQALAALDQAVSVASVSGFGFGIVVTDEAATKKPLQRLFKQRPLPSRPEILVVPQLECLYPLIGSRSQRGHEDV